MKNRISHIGVLLFLVMGMLLLMSYIPQFSLFGHQMRRVDILSDLHNHSLSDLDSLEIDTALKLPVKPAFQDTCKKGMVCIEDYSDSLMRGMTPFYKALDKLTRYQQPVRIAYYGDSFVEGDILTSDLREMLQSRFGGQGVGYTPISTISSGFRQTVRYHAEGWTRHSFMDSVRFDRSLQDVSNHYFKADSTATIRFRGQNKYYSRLDTFYRASFFFIPDSLVRLKAKVNGRQVFEKQYKGKDLQTMEVEGRIGDVEYSVVEADSNSLFYGVAMDGVTGISLDNFSMRGSSGLNVRSVPARMMRQFYELRPYDLVILQYGLNVATGKGSNYDNYIKGMQTTIQHIKDYFPNAGILIVSVADRDYKNEEGEIRTMPGIRNLIRYQQNLAAEEGVAFWNMFQAMGGNESMLSLVEAKPSMANYDYTHINVRGGKFLAGLLYDALIYGKEQYDRRLEYEKNR